ncbi:unnamed protein product [Bursaphelenchus xylophilus]|uniref:(pine wood nematode) hypothetical protein n=1 Tax=Bursaphelenchus xylophilus TaxID=6326 RepID=A0A1I7S6E3_BURXY|nr:unnamed protein product [Bursaphelenchus xylophilus]CAG9128078.1 unnamed protein product [Bursaphelenchus xylophilus]
MRSVIVLVLLVLAVVVNGEKSHINLKRVASQGSGLYNNLKASYVAKAVGTPPQKRDAAFNTASNEGREGTGATTTDGEDNDDLETDCHGDL